MFPILAIKKISLSQIDFNDFSYAISPWPENSNAESLRKSIDRYGILHPPIVREIAPGLYGIVAGRKRLLVLQSLQKEETCYCLIIPPPVPEIMVFEILLAETQLVRQLTTAEKAFFLQKIAPLADERRIITEFMPRLDLAPDPFILKQTLRLLGLEDPVLFGMHQGYINNIISLDLVSLSMQDRSALVKIIAALKPSRSNQKKLLQICKDLAGREQKSIAALLDQDEVGAILDRKDTNQPQKTKNLMTWLTRRHQPRALEAEEEFRRYIAAMRLPQNVSVTHTPFFENDGATLAITFRDREALAQVWEKIRHATSKNDN